MVTLLIVPVWLLVYSGVEVSQERGTTVKMDEKVTSFIEKIGKEVYKASSMSTSTRDALIAQIAAYLAQADLTSGQKSSLEDLRARLQALKNS
ncbi:hypothetical protein NG798_14420 [Ancylothrix sp. C2]|uniref:hypothetical protein n=1 Tax=Ancylothrix sp. D3o TaxID=2953691 RepID=UPI0021BABC89|nr:hypothetical protein [Ancylothrix sp. D3o]MCT7950990.1 hypothetical protein [Ancylothrix sp. D3o]